MVNKLLILSGIVGLLFLFLGFYYYVSPYHNLGYSLIFGFIALAIACVQSFFLYKANRMKKAKEKEPLKTTR